MEKAQAEDYLSSLLNKNLRITTSDTRIFHGQFKCTDSVYQPFPYLHLNVWQLTNPQDRNIILSQTFEYRLPPPPKAKDLQGAESITLDMTSRYLGLVVVPGEYITKIEVEEFASQMKGMVGVKLNSTTTVVEEGLIPSGVV